MPWIFFFSCYYLVFAESVSRLRLRRTALLADDFPPFRSRELKDRTLHLCPPPRFPRALERNGGGGGLPTRFLHLHHLPNPPSKSAFCSCQPRVSRIFTCDFFFFPWIYRNLNTISHQLLSRQKVFSIQEGGRYLYSTPQFLRPYLFQTLNTWLLT